MPECTPLPVSGVCLVRSGGLIISLPKRVALVLDVSRQMYSGSE